MRLRHIIGFVFLCIVLSMSVSATISDYFYINDTENAICNHGVNGLSVSSYAVEYDAVEEGIYSKLYYNCDTTGTFFTVVVEASSETILSTTCPASSTGAKTCFFGPSNYTRPIREGEHFVVTVTGNGGAKLLRTNGPCSYSGDYITWASANVFYYANDVFAFADYSTLDQIYQQIFLRNLYTNELLQNFTVNITNSTSSISLISTDYEVNYTRTSDTYNISFTNITDNTYYNTTFYDIDSSSINNTFYVNQTNITFEFFNLLTNTTFTGTNISITDSVYGIQGYTDTGLFTFSPTANETLHFSFSGFGIPDTEESFTFSELETGIYNITIGLLLNITLIDEQTNNEFDIDSTNYTRVIIVCEDIGSYEYNITSSSQLIPVPCRYQKLRFSISYDEEVYSRVLLSEDLESTYQEIYLIDLKTTQAIYNALIVNDYIGEYNNPRIYIKKNLEGDQVIIHSDYLDVENKMSIFLIENDEYIFELYSDNLPVNVLGFYGADVAGTKEITVTTANIDTSTPEIVGNGVTIYTYAKNISDETYAYAIFNDTTLNTNSITWSLFVLNETDQSLTEIYSVTSIGNYGELVFTGYNITNQTNNSIISAIQYTKGGLMYTYYKQITFADLDMSSDNMFGYLSASVLQWSVIIVLSVIALSGTMTTQNYANYGIIGLAALAKMFGFFPVSLILLILSMAVAFMFQIKSSEQTRIPR